jgi:hypothetical protein
MVSPSDSKCWINLPDKWRIQPIDGWREYGCVRLAAAMIMIFEDVDAELLLCYTFERSINPIERDKWKLFA